MYNENEELFCNTLISLFNAIDYAKKMFPHVIHDFLIVFICDGFENVQSGFWSFAEKK